MRRPLRALFYGQTHEHAPGKLETLKKMRDEYEIVAIVDDFPRRSPMYRDQAWDTAGYPVVSEEEAWRIPDIDVGFVEVTNRDLMEIAAKFAERGIPMHCDKPCGEDFEAYRRVVETCRAKGIPFQIGYMYRTNPALTFVRDFVRAGHLGKVGFVEADMNHAYNHDNYAAYMQTFAGGILYSLGCHLVDMVEPLVTGAPTRVTRVLKSAFGQAPGGKTDGLALLEFPETNVLIRAACEMPGGILCRRLRVDGTNGTLDLCPIERFDGEELTLALSLKNAAGGQPAGRHEVGFGVQTDRYAAQLLDLAAIVRGEKPNDQDYDRDLRVHELTLQACGLGALGASEKGQVK